MLLKDLENSISLNLCGDDYLSLQDLEIHDITSDSRKISQGDIFVALKGVNECSYKYIPDAIKNGASLIVIDQLDLGLLSTQYSNILGSNNPREFLAKATYEICKKYIPSKLITVTGTNGKTSVTSLVSQILTLMNKKVLTIGTIGTFIGNNQYGYSLTTPDCYSIAEAFKIGYEQNVEYAVMESSSHGIEQHRTAGLNFLSAGFTNLTQDHLDYHGTMEGYFNVKKRLFSKDKINSAVINVDDEYGKLIFQDCLNHNISIIDYGKEAKLIQIVDIVFDIQNKLQKVTINYKGEEIHFQTSILGEFQVYNICCAIGLLINANIDIKDIIPLLPQLKEIDGRLNLVQQNTVGSIFIDFAHTPNALEGVLNSLRQYKPSKLKVLFGCGGNRDKTKRPIMGCIATQYADVIYVTDDNPRFEEASIIRDEVISGVNQFVSENNLIDKEVYNVDNRYNAIEKAISDLKENEILLLAGKGHEHGQILGDKVIDFDEKQITIEILTKLGRVNNA